ncbi:MAG: hypothetical protein RIR91_346 [Verrucomicrobiota bacterium]|jgi:hypothetical protein
MIIGHVYFSQRAPFDGTRWVAVKHVLDAPGRLRPLHLAKEDGSIAIFPTLKAAKAAARAATSPVAWLRNI